MATERYNRVVVRSFNIVGRTLVAAACLMWLTTLADLLFGLGWGWDKQGLWIGPIIIAIGIATLCGGNLLFRLMGAAPAK